MAGAETTAAWRLLGALRRRGIACKRGGTEQVLMVEIWWSIAASSYDHGGQFFKKQNVK